jgi:hypothetical protein
MSGVVSAAPHLVKTESITGRTFASSAWIWNQISSSSPNSPHSTSPSYAGLRAAGTIAVRAT